MRGALRRLGYTVALLLALAGAARAQTIADQSQSIAAPAVNTQNTLTIPAVTGLFARVDEIVIGACQDATGNALSNVNFTTTNLGSLAWQVGSAAGASTCIQPVVLTMPQGGLKAAAASVAVTIVSPAASLHAAYPMAVFYHYSQY